RWMPEPYENHTVFDREFYWSPAYYSYIDETCWLSIRTQRGVEPYEGQVALTTDYYRWENRIEDFDMGASFLRPSLCIHKGLGLKRTDNPFKYVNKKDELSVFSAESKRNSDEALFVNKQQFEKFLS